MNYVCVHYDPDQAAALLEVASYYAVDGRLAALVEARLSAHLAAPPLPSVPPAPNNSADACMLDFALYAAKAAAAKADAAAPALLLLAERFDLKQLSAAARCHVVDHWSSVSATDAYVALPEDTKASVTCEAPGPGGGCGGGWRGRACLIRRS